MKKGILVFCLVLCGLSQAAAELFLRDILNGADGGKMKDPNAGYYNLKVGPVLVRMNAGVNSRYSDNINLATVNREEDLVTTPNFGIGASWQLTGLNTLNFNVSMGYSKYMNHPEADSHFALMGFGQTGGTGISMKVVVDDFVFTPRTNITYGQDASDSLRDNGKLATSYGRFNWVTGMDVVWNLANPIITMGYDHVEFFSINDDFEFVDYDGERFRGNAAFKVTDTITTGVEANGGMTGFRKKYQNDNWFVHMGPFYSMQLTNFLSFRLGAGGSIMGFDKGGSNGDGNTEFTGGYFNGSIHHMLNQNITHDLSGGRTTDLNVASNFIESYYMKYNITLGGVGGMFKNITVSPMTYLDFGQESNGISDPESFMRYTLGLSFGYRISEKLSSSLTYTYTGKESNGRDRNYFANQVSLNLGYSF